MPTCCLPGGTEKEACIQDMQQQLSLQAATMTSDTQPATFLPMLGTPQPGQSGQVTQVYMQGLLY